MELPNEQLPPYFDAGDAPPPPPPPPGFTVFSSSSSPASPSAPCLDQMQKIQGYENIAFHNEIIVPPALAEWKDEPPLRDDIANIPSLTDDEVEDAVQQYVSDHCCYGKGVAQQMTVNDIGMSSAFHYTLESFGEKRESAWKFVPFTGQPIDGPMNGPAPGPWDVIVEPSAFFQDRKVEIEVPHTAFVKPCHICVGNGHVRCSHCHGAGRKRCSFCHGSGRKNGSACTFCHSSGHRRCITCSGTGQVKCKTCDGHGNVKGFVQLTVTWTNHYDDYISGTSDLPQNKIRKATGDVLFGEESARVWPITHSGQADVNEASNNLVQKHTQDFVTERILKQRHCLRVVPIYEVNYSWKNKNDKFYIYGYDNKVYFEKYPQRCCWCCVIL